MKSHSFEAAHNIQVLYKNFPELSIWLKHEREKVSLTAIGRNHAKLFEETMRDQIVCKLFL